MLVRSFCPSKCNLRSVAFCFSVNSSVKKRKIKPLKYWEDISNVKHFTQYLSDKLNLKTPNDWENLTCKQILSNGGTSTLLNTYSLFEIKCFGCPEGKLIFTKIPKPKGYWQNENNVLQFINELKENFNLKTPNDWNLLTFDNIISFGGTKLLQKYSLFEIKSLGCPEGKLIFKEPPKPPGFWENKENVSKFISQLKETLNLNTIEDWNSLNLNVIISNGGSSALFNHYSLYDIKCLGFPQGKLIFEPKPIDFWDNNQNLKEFINYIQEKANLKTFTDWNSLTYLQIKNFGGSKLLQKLSLFDIKCLGFPSGKFLFFPKPKDFWNKENIIEFLVKISIDYNIHSVEDFNRLAKKQIISKGGRTLCSKYSKKDLIQIFSSDIMFSDVSSISERSGRSSQRWLFLQIQKLFPDEEIVEDYFHSEISRKTGFSIQFDIFLIKRNIAIEYHGKQHYEDIPAGFAPLEAYRKRDNEKLNICSAEGIQLIIIPYWWDNSLDSLKKTLQSKMDL